MRDLLQRMTLLSDAIDDKDPVAIHEALQNDQDETILIYLMTHSPRLSTMIQLVEAIPASVNYVDDDTDMLPLHYAIREGSIDMAHFLLENGAKINVNDQDGNENSPLHYAISSPCITLLLLVNGANPNLQNEDGDTPLHLAIREDAPFETVLLLLANGADPSIRNENGDTCLFIAVKKQDIKLLNTLVIHGANPRERLDTGSSLLQYAKSVGLRRSTEWLNEAMA